MAEQELLKIESAPLELAKASVGEYIRAVIPTKDITEDGHIVRILAGTKNDALEVIAEVTLPSQLGVAVPADSLRERFGDNVVVKTEIVPASSKDTLTATIDVVAPAGESSIFKAKLES